MLRYEVVLMHKGDAENDGHENARHEIAGQN